MRDIPIPAQDAAARIVDGATMWRLHVPLPADLPLGWHTVHAAQRAHGASRAGPHRRSACSSSPLRRSRRRRRAPTAAGGRGG